ncbi:hypothetical protein P7K49_000126, partial [Saguinus oedipus]
YSKEIHEKQWEPSVKEASRHLTAQQRREPHKLHTLPDASGPFIINHLHLQVPGRDFRGSQDLEEISVKVEKAKGKVEDEEMKQPQGLGSVPTDGDRGHQLFLLGLASGGPQKLKEQEEKDSHRASLEHRKGPWKCAMTSKDTKPFLYTYGL